MHLDTEYRARQGPAPPDGENPNPGSRRTVPRILTVPWSLFGTQGIGKPFIVCVVLSTGGRQAVPCVEGHCYGTLGVASSTQSDQFVVPG